MEITARKTAIQSTVSLFKYTITLFIFLYQCQNPARQGYDQNDHRDDSHDPEDFCLSYRLILHASCKSFWVDRHEKGNGKADRIQNNTYPKFHRCSPLCFLCSSIPQFSGKENPFIRSPQSPSAASALLPVPSQVPGSILFSEEGSGRSQRFPPSSSGCPPVR